MEKKKYNIPSMRVGRWYYDENNDWLVMRQKDGVIAVQKYGPLRYYPLEMCSTGFTYVGVKDVGEFLRNLEI